MKYQSKVTYKYLLKQLKYCSKNCKRFFRLLYTYAHARARARAHTHTHTHTHTQNLNINIILVKSLKTHRLYALLVSHRNMMASNNKRSKIDQQTCLLVR